MLRLFKHYVPRGLVVLGLIELALVLLGAELAWRLYAQQIAIDAGPLADRALPIITFATTLHLGLLATGYYSPEAISNVRVGMARLLTGVSLGVIFLSLLRFLLPEMTLWRANSLYAMGLVILLLVTSRALLMRLVGSDLFRRRILVLGAGPRARRIADLAQQPGRSFVIAGHVAMQDGEQDIADAVPRSAISSLSAHAEMLAASEVVLAIEERRNSLPVSELLRVKTTGVQVIDIAGFIERETGRVDLATTNPSSLIFSDGFSAGQRISRVIKRTFDIVVSSLLLALVWPVLLVTAVAIKLEGKGPIVYRQTRVGRYGAEYEVLKLRSMRTDAEAPGKAVWAAENDPRVTRVGRIIRKLRIDEIPQCWCILRGDMSFVGPRPERPCFVRQLIEDLPFYDERHMVKPGLTGWAQVNYPYGASIDDARAKLEYDLYYAKNYSPFLDILILLQTVRVVLWPTGAR